MQCPMTGYGPMPTCAPTSPIWGVHISGERSVRLPTVDDSGGFARSRRCSPRGELNTYTFCTPDDISFCRRVKRWPSFNQDALWHTPTDTVPLGRGKPMLDWHTQRAGSTALDVKRWSPLAHVEPPCSPVAGRPCACVTLSARRVGAASVR